MKKVVIIIGCVVIGLFVVGKVWDGYVAKTVSDNRVYVCFDGMETKSEDLYQSHSKSVLELRRLDIELSLTKGDITEAEAQLMNIDLDYQWKVFCIGGYKEMMKIVGK